jgi:endonuclease III
VHATGFSAKAVGSFMPKLLEAYSPWDECGLEKFDDVMKRVKLVCNNPQKAKAIHSTAKKLVNDVNNKMGWSDWKNQNLSSVEEIGKLPYIGKITRYHLGRNIGLLNCVKPDLHLVRMAEHWGFKDCEEMCRSMREEDDVPLGIVDLALWYSASTFGTIQIKSVDGR